ncbi:DUF4176 domain-containing protein [Bacillus massilinigeriensis]|uniref:DUF4176 domain-containing protein n=1 Tax=Bacillus mediterraneensis TaxID=1805474 RepID=UPI0008F968CE|nr:DUF4176 domain-containing protein [Bacillus mediterraneensis]
MDLDINSLKIDKGSNWLPIGTVLLLEQLEQPLMIYGRFQQQVGKGKTWDYVACPYPQGHISDETNVFFNHTEIKRIIFKGFESEGEIKMRGKLEIIKANIRV